jgi:hypothetical protein
MDPGLDRAGDSCGEGATFTPPDVRAAHLSFASDAHALSRFVAGVQGARGWDAGCGRAAGWGAAAGAMRGGVRQRQRQNRGTAGAARPCIDGGEELRDCGLQARR